jgi:hypothetical protein
LECFFSLSVLDSDLEKLIEVSSSAKDYKMLDTFTSFIHLKIKRAILKMK